MKKALRAAILFMLAAVMVFLFTGCPDSASTKNKDSDLSGTISIDPASGITGTQLTAIYSGEEKVTYQWKRDGANVGANSNLFTADTAGTYTVTISGSGYNPKTSNTASIYRMNGAVPIITSSYTADPSARVFEGRLYLYPSRDISPVTGYNYSKMDRYHVYSTDNMVDWIDHGEILRRNDLPLSATAGNATDGAWGPHYADAMFMQAPDAAYKDGKYFFYFPHALGNTSPSWRDSWTIGVAWSNSPYGGFKDNVVRLKDSEGNYIYGAGSLIDPCVFQDGDDYYLLTGGNEEFRIAKLKPNMIELAEPLTPYAEMPELQHFNKGPWMFKRGDIYYLMYSGNPSGDNGDNLLYAVGGSPKGPWEYKGIILDPAGTGDTSQGSITEFNNKWYLFYHNARLSEGKGALRSVCVDELFFNSDGTIQKVLQTGASIEQNGPPLNTASLDSTFGAGNWRAESKYDEKQSGNLVGYALIKTSYAMDNSVIVGGGAIKGTHDIPAGAIHNLHLSGAFAEFTEIPGNGGKAFIRLGYALGDGSASIQITVNGVAISPRVTLLSTGGWAAVADSDFFEVNLNSGNNTIRLSGAGVNIASMSIYVGIE
jgi:hypothetical protein